ncbi:MAG: PaaI family thioesterase [Acidobacteriaceae bacterium]
MKPESNRKSAKGHTSSVLNPLLGRKLNYCFGCGPANPNGLHLRFVLDAEAGTATASFRLTRRYEGPPGHIHGGIVATLLDEAMGKVNRLKEIVAVTRHMEVDYLRPVPLREKLTVTGWATAAEGRKNFHQAEIRNQAGEVLARSKGLFITIDPVAMFARQQKRQQRNSTL